MELMELVKELGWQGGTVYQVRVEVKKLRKLETLLNRVPNGYGTICRCFG